MGQEELNESKIKLSVFNYGKNMIGLDVFFKDKYTVSYLPEIRYCFPHKKFIIRTGLGFFNYHNQLDTKDYGVFDSYKSVNSNYFQTDAWIGLEKEHKFGFFSLNYFIETGPGLVFYSGEYMQSSQAQQFNSSFSSRALYINLRPGFGLNLKLFRGVGLYIESSFVIDRSIIKTNDIYNLLPRSRLSPKPIGQLGLSYVFN